MGKGGGDCASRTALVLEGREEERMTPGKSARAQFTYQLLESAGGFTPEYLLRNLKRVSLNAPATIPPAKAEASTMVHNALMHWAPSSYPGHAGYVDAHEPNRWEMFYALLLDGDNKANHTYFYRDSEAGGEWTLAAGAALRGWYRLPCGKEGHIHPERLPQCIVQGLDHPGGSFLDNLRSSPSATLARCVDISEPGTSFTELAERLELYSPMVREQMALRYSKTQKTLAGKLTPLQVRNALDLGEASNLTTTERESLVLASLYLPGFGVSPDAAMAEAKSAIPGSHNDLVVRLIGELAPVTADQANLPVLVPSTPSGKILADAQQSWMASPLCDIGGELYRLQHQEEDTIANLERLKILYACSPWHSTAGRTRFQAPSRRQETRIRSLGGLARGGKTPSAPKNLKRLKALS